MLTILFSFLLLAAFGYIACKNLTVALALIPALSPLYLIRFDLGPVPTTLLELLLLTAILPWLFTKPWQRIAFTKYQVALLGLIGIVLCIGTLVATDTISALGIAKAYYIEPLLLFFALKDKLNQNDFRFALHALGTTALLLGLFGVFQWATGLGLPIPYDFLRRITSAFPYPNAYGLFVTPVIAVFGVLAAKERNTWYAALAGFLGMTLVLSQTEAGIVALLGITGIFVYTQLKTLRTKTIFGALCALTIVAALALPFSRSKLLLQDYSGLVRRSQWQETAELLKDHPFFGVGFNTYPTALAPYHTHTVYEIFQYPHNLFLNAWVEAGIFNVVLISILIGILARMLWMHKKMNTITLACALGLTAMCIHGLVDVPFYKNDLALITAFMLAVLLSNQSTVPLVSKADIS